MFDIIMFDLDGTLTNSMPGITKCVKYALSYYGIEETDEKKLLRFIGPPLFTSFSQFYNLSEDIAHGCVEKYREKYRIDGWNDNSVYDGIEDMLKSLKNSGKTVALATSKPEEFSFKILEFFSLKKYFDILVGATFNGKRNEKDEVIAEVIKRSEVNDRKRFLMVGDRKMDIIGAKQNGISSVGVEYGFCEKDELQHAGADFVVKTVKELEELLLSI